MLSREDFVFTIGYDGPSAVVDNRAKSKYKKLSTKQLVENGLFRAAYSSAVYSKDTQEQRFVAEAFHKLTGKTEVSDADVAALGKLFGVYLVDVKRTTVI